MTIQMKKAVGASYCLDQSPGAERYGGLTITLLARAGARGTITVRPTEWQTGILLDGIGAHAATAKQGLCEAAERSLVDLNQFDVILSDFAYHPVDSRETAYSGAAKSAFESAWEAWRRYEGVSR